METRLGNSIGRSLQGLQVGDNILAVCRIRHVDEHLGAMDIGGRISEELIQGVFIPCDVRCLQRGRIVVVGLGSALAAEYACERWADLVVARCRRMACRAAREYLLSVASPAAPAGEAASIAPIAAAMPSAGLIASVLFRML